MIRNHWLWLFTTLTATAATSGPQLVNWDSPDGVRRLERSAYKTDFFPLANQFEAQTNKLFCGPTSGTIILNALRLSRDDVKKPEAPTTVTKEEKSFLPEGANPNFERYSQENFLNAETEKVKSRLAVFGQGAKDYGLQLEQLAGMLRSHGLKVEVRHVTKDLPLKTFRDEWKANLKKSGDYIIANYHRPALGQKGGGHISPVAAYDAASDSFLVLDVNPTAAPWVWVKAQYFYQAMNTKDTDSNRGYLLVSEGR